MAGIVEFVAHLLDVTVGPTAPDDPAGTVADFGLTPLWLDTSENLWKAWDGEWITVGSEGGPPAGGTGQVASGTATIADTESSETVDHGLDVEPQAVVVTAHEIETLAVTARDGSTFTVSRTGTSGTLTFDWVAAEPVLPPEQVVGLVADADGLNIDLSWDPAARANMYEGERERWDGADWVDNTTIFDDVEDTEHRDEGLAADTTYRYRVRGVSAVGAGDWSDWVEEATGQAIPADGLVLHLDAAAIVGLDDDDPVTQWDDQSGQDNHAEAPSGEEPVYKTGVLNGRPVVRWTHPEKMDGPTIAGIHESSFTLFVVAEPFEIDSSITYRGLFQIHQHSSGWWFARNRQNERWEVWHTSSNVATGPNTIDFEPTIMVGLKEHNTRYRHWHNQTEIFNTTSSGMTGSFTNGPYRLSQVLGVGSGRSWEGDIAEVILYDRALTDIERGDVEAYLAAKWDITLT